MTETLTDKEFEKLGLQLTNAELNDMYMGTFIHPYIRQIFTDPQTGNFNVAAVKQYMSNFDNLDTAQRKQLVEIEKT